MPQLSNGTPAKRKRKRVKPTPVQPRIKSGARLKIVYPEGYEEQEEISNPGDPDQDGYYWIYDHRHDSVYMLLFCKGAWQDQDVQYEGMEMKEIMEGPLPFPTAEQIAGHQAHFEAFRLQEWEDIGFDPMWDLGEPSIPIDDGLTLHAPPPMMDGWFWIQFSDEDEPVMMRTLEGRAWTMGIDDERWNYADPECSPEILFGPLIMPDRTTVKSRDPEVAALARARILGRIQ